MTFCRSIYVKKVMKLLAFIFEQPSYHTTLKLCYVKTSVCVCVCARASVCVCVYVSENPSGKSAQTSSVSTILGANRVVICTKKLHSRNLRKKN